MEYLPTGFAALFAAACFVLSWWNRIKFNQLQGSGNVHDEVYARLWSIRFIYIAFVFVLLAVWAWNNR